MLATPNDMLSAAIKIAVDAHGSTVGRDGVPYILHPLRIMLRADGNIDQAVAVLHDVLEDTGITVDDLSHAGLSKEIISAVCVLTRPESQPYSDFIEDCKGNPIARRVKLLDLEDNMNLLRLSKLGHVDMERIEKYHEAHHRLKAAKSSP